MSPTWGVHGISLQSQKRYPCHREPEGRGDPMYTNTGGDKSIINSAIEPDSITSCLTKYLIIYLSDGLNP